MHFHIEAFHAGMKRELDFRPRFCPRLKKWFRRVAARRQNARQFAAGDDVETAAQRGEVFDDAQIAVGFNGVADERGKRGKRGLVVFKCVSQRGLAVHIKRCAEFFGKAGIGDLFAMQGHVGEV